MRDGVGWKGVDSKEYEWRGVKRGREIQVVWDERRGGWSGMERSRVEWTGVERCGVERWKMQ